MKSRIAQLTAASMLLATFAFAPMVRAQDKDASGSTVQVHMVVTDESVKGDAAPVAIAAKDIVVKQGKNNLKVSGLVAAQGDNAGLQLFILIDDTSDTALGGLLGDVRAFIAAQPATTQIGVGYAANAITNISQNFTDDKAAAAKAIRLPFGTLSAMDSPYLSLADLIKRWPPSKLRREVVFFSSGIDRLRLGGGGFGPSGFGGNTMGGNSMGGSRAAMNSYSDMSGDVQTASNAAQRSGVIVHTIYAQGVGGAGRNFWQVNNGLSGLSQVSDETGGESFSLGTQNVPSYEPYLNRLQTLLNNQYFLIFQANPGKKDQLQPVKFSTEVPNVEIVGARNVWVPVSGTPDKK